MSESAEYIIQLNIKETLSQDKYIIPIYQRNYAWEAKEIKQLIQDIVDFAITYPDKNYYIGTLVVAQGQNGFDTIDGQQRLTTLNILSSVIKNEYSKVEWFSGLNIRFASRKKSMDGLQAAYNGEFPDSEYETNIKAAYDICKTELKNTLDENKVSIDFFVKYLYNYVQIIR